MAGSGHALVPEVRAVLMTSVVSAVEELAPPGSVLEGPPAKFSLEPRAPVVPSPGDAKADGPAPPRTPGFDEPSPLDEQPSAH